MGSLGTREPILSARGTYPVVARFLWLQMNRILWEANPRGQPKEWIVRPWRLRKENRRCDGRRNAGCVCVD